MNWFFTLKEVLPFSPNNRFPHLIVFIPFLKTKCILVMGRHSRSRDRRRHRSRDRDRSRRHRHRSRYV